MPPEAPSEVVAFAPGRVNLIGEHTDYNDGLALPFAITEGVTVRARATQERRIVARAVDLCQQDAFGLDRPPAKVRGWRAFARGMAAELAARGVTAPAARLEISGTLARGAGLSSSAALEVALYLALLALAGEPYLDDAWKAAETCSAVERDWVGADTGLLDQLASLCGRRDAALLIDFQTRELEPVRLQLGAWRLVTVDSGERHAHAASGYNRRRQECREACARLGIATLREATPAMLDDLPVILANRVRHVIGENERVQETVAALGRDDLPEVGRLLDASHASLRDLYEISTPAVEAAVERLHSCGAAGARLVGGGFGGSVLGLLPPGSAGPPEARTVRPGPGASLLR